MYRFRTTVKAVVGTSSLVLAILVAPTAGAANSAGSAPGVARHAAATTAADQQKVRDYWTPDRMRRAIPREEVRAITPMAKPGTTSGTAVRVPAQPQLGKVYFTMDGVNYVCSGTATQSTNADVVTTAGHCVNEGPGAFATNFAFVPAYDNGSRPYGTWVAEQLLTTTQWATSGDFNYDVGFAVMAEQSTKSLTDVTGSYPIAFNLGYRLQFKAYGYPHAAPYDGQYLYMCSGKSGRDIWTLDHSLKCTMTGGSSGGGWITNGKLNSLNSFKYSNNPNVMYGPYFGNAIAAVYATAATS